jgi:hypothetical protein
MLSEADIRNWFDPDRPIGTATADVPDSTPVLPAGEWARRASALLAFIADDEYRTHLRDWFEERAGVGEYDVGLSRDEAERGAYEQIEALYRQGVRP